MPLNQESSNATITIGTFNDVQGNQHNTIIYQSNTSGTPQQSLLPSDTTPRFLHKHVLPSPPELMIGRDKEKAEIVDTLLQKPPARVVILGGGGMGKTTLALSILHEGAIADKYPSRYFVSCEGVLSISSLIEEIANILQIPPAKRDTFLMNTIFSTFPDMTLLCLDNFETLWDDEAMRPEIEEFLSLLQHQVLGLIITMRGAQRPSRVSWSKPFLSPLQPVTEDISRRIYEEMTGDSVDEFVERLLIAVDGIPLAISLISALLQDGFESSESLWSRWQTQSGVLERGGKHRLSNLDTSIHLFVYGPRMLENPTTIDILAMLSVLPDGLPDDGKVVEELQHHLPEGYHLRKALLTMQRVSLVQVVQVDGAAVRRRLRMLSPIQSFCQRTLSGSEELRNSITSFYVQKMDHFKDITDPAGHAVIPSELHNVRAVLMQAWRGGKGDSIIAIASIRFTWWTMYLGNPVEEVLHAAMQAIVGPPALLGRCHAAMGEVHLRQSKLDEAEESLKHAIEFHQQTHNVIGEGNCLNTLGYIYLRRDKLDEAEELLKYAIGLHQQVHDVLGEGNSLGRLGNIYLRRDKLDEAEESLKRAIELHQQVHDIIGEGNCLGALAEVYLRQSKLDEAEELLKRVVELYKQAHSVHGEGNGLWRLGGLYLQQSKLDEAEELFKRAMELHKQVNDVLGKGNDLWRLGELYLHQSKLDKAEESLKHAIELYKQAHSVLSEGNCLGTLAEVYLRQSKLDEAEESLKRAIELHQQAHEVVGEGNDLQSLVEVYLRQSKLGEAEESLKRAMELRKQGHDVLGKGNDLWRLAEIYLRQSKLDEAEESSKRAIELYKQVHSVLGEGNGLARLGEVYLRQDKLDEAEESLKRAIELHQQAHEVSGEGDDLQHLGGVYLRRDKLDEAEESLKRAVELHQQAHDVFDEGNDLRKLGELHLRRDELDEAEASFKRATELHQQAHDVLGEGNTLHKLGELYMRRDNLHAAEVSFERAAELHRKAHDVAGEGRDLEKLETVRLRRSQLDESEAPLERDDKPPSIHGGANRVLPSEQVHSQRLQLDEANISSEGATEFHRPAHSVLSDDADGIRNVGHADGNIPSWPVIPAQTQGPSQHQPKKLTFRKKFSALFSSRRK